MRSTRIRWRASRYPKTGRVNSPGNAYSRSPAASRQTGRIPPWSGGRQWASPEPAASGGTVPLVGARVEVLDGQLTLRTWRPRLGRATDLFDLAADPAGEGGRAGEGGEAVEEIEGVAIGLRLGPGGRIFFSLIFGLQGGGEEESRAAGGVDRSVVTVGGTPTREAIRVSCRGVNFFLSPRLFLKTKLRVSVPGGVGGGSWGGGRQPRLGPVGTGSPRGPPARSAPRREARRKRQSVGVSSVPR